MSFRCSQGARRFLHKANWRPFLKKCHEINIINHAFNLDYELSLELYIDPEIDDNYLTLYIRKNHYEEDFMSTIDSIRRIFDDIEPYVCVTTDFQPKSSVG